jgi:uncharacterized membrane protein YqjE
MNPLDALRILRRAGSALFNQAALHAQLARVEWEEEKARLLKMVVAALAAFAGALSLLILISVLVLAFSWDTSYRVPASIAIVVLYLLGIMLAWRRLQFLSSLSSHAFSATRQELALDIETIRNNL